MKNARLSLALKLASLFLGLLPAAALAQKTDVVLLENGDAVTGEVNSLEFAELRYSTDSMGTVSIEWGEVLALTSNQSLQVEVTSGTRYFGNLLPASGMGKIAIGRGEFLQEVDINTVVRITPIETDEKIWQRFEGSVSFGFNTTKASEVTTGTLSADIRYRARTYLLGADIFSTVTDQPGAETTENQSVKFNYQRFRDNRWYTDWFVGAESNNALGVDVRYSLGGGFGRYLIQTNRNQFSLLAGLNGTQEHLSGLEQTTNVEGKFSVRYQHRNNDPENRVTFTTNVFPLLEDFSSFRSDSNLTMRHEFVDDLFFDLTLYYNYISKPPEGSEQDDYGVTTSIGYSF